MAGAQRQSFARTQLFLISTPNEQIIRVGEGSVAAKTLPPDGGYEWRAMSSQENAVGHQMYDVFPLTLLLV